MKNQRCISSIRCLFNSIFSPESTETQEVVVSLDGEKVFNRVEWGGSNEVLHWPKYPE